MSEMRSFTLKHGDSHRTNDYRASRLLLPLICHHPLSLFSHVVLPSCRPRASLLYCSMSTNASNSSMFFSYTASFSGSESCRHKGQSCWLFFFTVRCWGFSPLILKARSVLPDLQPSTGSWCAVRGWPVAEGFETLGRMCPGPSARGRLSRRLDATHRGRHMKR